MKIKKPYPKLWSCTPCDPGINDPELAVEAPSCKCGKLMKQVTVTCGPQVPRVYAK